MIMMGLHFLGKVPFKEVFVHGIVRDIHGKKMSKSLGNVIDPLEIVKKYGTDALRFSLVSSTTAGRDIHLSEENFVLSRNFMNKIYNMTRFILMNIPQDDVEQLKNWLKKPILSYIQDFNLAEYWILAELQKLLTEINQYQKKYMLGNIAHQLYDFVWFKFCDWYLEIAKVNIHLGKKLTTLGMLIWLVDKIVKLLHPIIPFFTEHIYQTIKQYFPQQKNSILEEQFPESILQKEESEKFYEQSQLFELIKNIISEIRTIRNEFKLQLAIKPNIILTTSVDEIGEILTHHIPYIQTLGYVNNVEIVNKNIKQFIKPKYSSSSVFTINMKYKSVELFVLLEGIIDFKKEKLRLKKEIDEIQLFLNQLESKLQNKEFLSKAPQQEIQKVKEKYNTTKEKISKLLHIYSEMTEV
ncbi:MAG: class I tRNA ligase family protein, partial [Endomicrobia bacterium]|nr:class I tRNA ligase family protein [Endomicrobiia bacterium]